MPVRNLNKAELNASCTNPADSVSGPPPRPVPFWRLENLCVGVRLRVVFACVLVLMVTGGAITLWQFHSILNRVREVSVAEQRVTAVMRVNNGVLMLMSRLHRASEGDDRQQFDVQAKHLLDEFRTETAGATALLRQVPPQTGRQELVADSLADMLDTLPERIASLTDLARAGDWNALHGRLIDQVDHNDEVGEQLMQETSADLLQARSHLFEDIEQTERRAVQVLLISSLLSLVVAGVLGDLVTRGITRRLSALDHAALAVAHGDFNQQVPAAGADELANLANAFNRMTRELADLYARESEARKTAELLNQTLQRANDDLRVFAYSASHDLQEPLRNITLYSQLLERDCGSQLDSNGNELLGHVVDGAKRMSELISDLLAYIDVSSGESKPQAQASAQAAVETALSNLKAVAVANGATVFCEDLPAVAVKPVHLQQLFQNLIGNAIKYRSDAPPVIRIAAFDQGEAWQFSVRDNGIGIDPQYRNQIFRLFQRLHCRSKYPGTGIGLAICQKIVERYGGQIWVEAGEGTGSDFRFTFPKPSKPEPSIGAEVSQRRNVSVKLV